MKTLKGIFEVRPEKTTITFKGKCSDCKCDVTINITVTSSGFGLQDGSLFEPLPNCYFAKCLDCYKIYPFLGDRYKQKYRCKIVN